MSLDFPGFADPVTGAQSTFRAILDALSRPGSIREAGAGLTPPAPLTRAAAASLLTLIDADTPLWLAPAFYPARDWIAFHCGAPVTDNISEASFVLADSMPALDALHAGTDEAPEDSATVLLQVSALGFGTRLRLAGPGLRAPEILAVDGLPENFVATWRQNREKFPRGIDVLLCATETLAAMPRGIAIVEA